MITIIISFNNMLMCIVILCMFICIVICIFIFIEKHDYPNLFEYLIIVINNN